MIAWFGGPRGANCGAASGTLPVHSLYGTAAASAVPDPECSTASDVMVYDVTGAVSGSRLPRSLGDELGAGEAGAVRGGGPARSLWRVRTGPKTDFRRRSPSRAR